MAQSLLHDALRDRFAKIIHEHNRAARGLRAWDELKREYPDAYRTMHFASTAYTLADKLIDEMNRMAPDTTSEAA